MRLIALRQIHLSLLGRTVIAGESFQVPDEAGNELVRSGIARASEPPQIRYETKVITPEAPEVSARPGFCNVPRDVPLPDAQQTELAAESDRVLSEPDVSEQRTADSRGRGRRAGSGSRT